MKAERVKSVKRILKESKCTKIRNDVGSVETRSKRMRIDFTEESAADHSQCYKHKEKYRDNENTKIEEIKNEDKKNAKP